MDLEALLKSTEFLSKNPSRKITETYLQPFRQVKCIEFLTDNPVSFRQLIDNFDHWFIEDRNWKMDEFCIVHGHKVDFPCNAPSFCHTFGYWPDIGFHPTFIKQFEIKWGKIYQENGWDIVK